jgi:ribosome biogenesis protein BMS1
VALVKTLQNTRYSLDEKLEQSFINFFGGRPAAQSKDSDAEGNVISASQDDQGDTNLQQVDNGNNSNAVTMESNEHSEGSSDSEEDNDDIQLRDRDVDLREEVEICNGRLRRKAVSANFLDDVDDEVYCFLISLSWIFFLVSDSIACQFMIL